MAWKQLSYQERYQSPWLRITEDKVITEAGKSLTWSVIHQKPCAMVLPWDGERFVLVKLYRYVINRASWEFPAGSVADVSMDEAAKLELKQETGFSAGAYEHIGKVFLANGSSTQSMDIYLATDLVAGEAEPDEGEEGIESRHVTYAELCQMINDGSIHDSPSIAAVGYLCTSGWVDRNVRK
ncbi:MAG: NUDIX hydrolase [Patescibacteria group bacterium]